MSSRPLALAALATAAVPGLRPVQVEGVSTRSGSPYRQALVTDHQGQQWQVRSARSTAAAAALDQTERLARLIGKRLAFGLPQRVGGTTASDGSTVAVYRQLPGQPLSWRALQPRSEEARSLGRALAQLHDLDPRLYDEAGLPSYDADAFRSRRLAELDRAAGTGHVPAPLLGRWERALEEVSLWRFATTPTHGALRDGDAWFGGGEVVALDSWEAAAVSDPATDFALLTLIAEPDAVDTVVEAYAQSRRERPDTHLERRIRLATELRRVTDLMEAAAADDDLLVDRRAAALRRLQERTDGDESLLPPPVTRRTTASVEAVATSEPRVDPADIEVVEVREADDDDETVEIPQIDEDGDGDGPVGEDVPTHQDDVPPHQADTVDEGDPADLGEAKTAPVPRKRPDPNLHAG